MGDQQAQPLTPEERGKIEHLQITLREEGIEAWRAGEGRRLVVRQMVRTIDLLLATIDAKDRALRESREELGAAVRLLDDIDGAMSLGSVRRGVALMQDVAQADWVFGTLKKIRAYLAARHPEPVEEEPNG